MKKTELKKRVADLRSEAEDLRSEAANLEYQAAALEKEAEQTPAEASSLRALLLRLREAIRADIRSWAALRAVEVALTDLGQLTGDQIQRLQILSRERLAEHLDISAS
jgi:predicted nuclease with TOPRIM domain